jgi:hypothetical protein
VYTCALCHFLVELDDTVFKRPDGWAVCLRCFYHEVGDERAMSDELRRWLEAALSV